MSGDVSYVALATAIARHVHDHWYREESRIDLPPIHTFDTLCASYFQIPAGVLAKLSLLRPLDDIGRRWAFTVGPKGFGDVVRTHRGEGCSFDTLVLAAIAVVEHDLGNQEILDLLAELGICEPVTYQTRTAPLPPESLTDYMSQEKWGTIKVPDFQIVWTDRKAHYDTLRRDWPTLIA